MLLAAESIIFDHPETVRLCPLGSSISTLNAAESITLNQLEMVRQIQTIH